MSIFVREIQTFIKSRNPFRIHSNPARTLNQQNNGDSHLYYKKRFDRIKNPLDTFDN